MRNSEQAAPMFVALEQGWPPICLSQDVPEWSLRAKDQLLLASSRTPKDGDLIVVRREGRGFLTRYPLCSEYELVGVITSVMRLRP